MSKASPNSSSWIAGINAVASSLEHDAEHVREVLIEAGQKNPRLTEIEERARQLDVPVRKVNAQAIGGVAGDLRHQGVVARYEAAKPTSEADLPGLIEAADGKALLLVLDGVQDPHNLGACLRSAAAAGATAVIIPKDKAAPVNATVRKTSAGAADRLPIVSVTNLARTLRTIKDLGVWVYGLDGEAPDSLYGVDLKGNVALVLGGEAEGMRRLTREHCDGLVRILMPGTMESLNVSVAAGVALFECVRQRLGSVT
jgi:23S rRNA (guanosine2251-2'-O)-methyltransferase